MKRLVSALAGMLIVAGAAVPASAVVNLVQNGGFELTSLPARNADLGASATLYDGKSSLQMSSNSGTQYVNNWFNCSTNSYCAYGSSGTTAGYAMLMTNATTSSTIYTNDNNTMSLWGQPGKIDNAVTNSAAAGRYNTLALSPNGGNFLAADGAYNSASINQVVTGLTVGRTYDLTFYYAGAQQYGFDGPTTEGWDVFLTNTASPFDVQSYSTATLNDAAHAFTGWKTASTSFRATNATALLSFLAQGTPDGKPPFSLLDGVSLVERVTTPSAVPEPASWATMIAGFGLVGAAMRRRRRAGPQAA